ncbi:hypothetical protein RRF57_003791 [Xylaria bambusicola]|uniref:Uncharacterized protein n=1 Tax=Xylaria bambusicola TaxID=326684 RepID=A0AAN7UMC7_9PEZI
MPLNIVAKTIACVAGRGSKPAVISSQNAAYTPSIEGQCEQGAMGWTARKYRAIRRSAACRDGRNCRKLGGSPTWPKRKPLVGTICWFVGFKKSGSDDSDMLSGISSNTGIWLPGSGRDGWPTGRCEIPAKI